MKKRLLIIGLVMMLVLAGCGNKNKEYKENIYNPIQNNITQLESTMEDYYTRVDNTIAGSKDEEEVSLEQFFKDLETMKESISKIKPLEFFTDEDKKSFEGMIDDFENAIDNINDSAVNIVGMFGVGSNETIVSNYENANKMGNSYLDDFLEKYNTLNKEYGIKEEAKIKNRTFTLTDLTKGNEPFSNSELSELEIYLKPINDDGSIMKSEVNKEDRAVNLIILEGIGIDSSDNSIYSLNEGLAKDIKNLDINDVTVNFYFEDDKENYLQTIFNGTTIVFEIENYLKQNPKKDLSNY